MQWAPGRHFHALVAGVKQGDWREAVRIQQLVDLYKIDVKMQTSPNILEISGDRLLVRVVACGVSRVVATDICLL